MRVGIWGSYNHGNFGDDVMALQFAKCVELLGHTPTIYRFYDAPSLCKDLRVENRLETFVANSEKIIIGGGGMMTGTQAKRALFRPRSLLAEFDYYLFRSVAMKHQREIVPLSIGSDGAQNASQVPWLRRRLLSSPLCRYATVRLKSDVGLMEKMGVHAIYAADVVYSLPTIFPVERPIRSDKRLRVGINLSARRCGTAISAIETWARQRNDVRLVYLRTHRNSSKYTYEYVPRVAEDDLRRVVVYAHPTQFIKELAGLDVIVSSKLHVGLIGQIYGTAFISYQGSGKARLELSQRELNDRVMHKGDESKLVNLVESLALNANSDREFESVNKLAGETVIHRQMLEHFISDTVESLLC